jgi:hypothetical protein
MFLKTKTFYFRKENGGASKLSKKTIKERPTKSLCNSLQLYNYSLNERQVLRLLYTVPFFNFNMHKC